MKQLYDGLVFDMDGVLVDVTNSYRTSIKQTAEYFLKREVSIDEVKKVKDMVGMNNDWDATYTLINNKNLEYTQVKQVFQNYYLGTAESNGLIDNETLLVTRETLIKMKDVYKKLGIATGRPKEEALYVLRKFNLLDLFNSVVTKDDCVREKPYPEPILLAISEMNVNRPVYIGDSPSDVVASTAACIPCIYIGEQSIGTIRFQTMSQVITYLL